MSEPQPAARAARTGTWKRRGRIALAALGFGAVGLAGGAWGLAELDCAYPPPIEAALERSTEIVDRDGQLLRAFATKDGRWRLGVDLADLDKQFVAMLLAFEDKRFATHDGVDMLALLRAAGQFAGNGRIVSGGSTLSMQLARLIEPRKRRSVTAKIMQIARAIQIERRLAKGEILALYLTLAPYGGNLEGVRAAALAWFGKEPRRLTVSEAALLVAIPQLPELRRPDRNHAAARAARDRVLARAVTSGLISEDEASMASADPVPSARKPLPALAAHVAEAARRSEPTATRLEVTLQKAAQAGLEASAREAASRLGPKLSVAMVMADAATGEIIAEVGSADYFDTARNGFIDMTRVARSPGSTLKPFIYGLAFEDGQIAQETIVEDRPASFSGYRPRNFDMAYQGDVSIRTALQKSLNVPAVRLLDAVGPARLMARFRQAGIDPVLPRGKPAGLAIGLGGLGMSLHDLVQLYTGLVNGGRVSDLTDRPRKSGETPSRGIILPATAAWQIADILSGVAPPENAIHKGIAYKTGTSYGYRDAWAIGFDGKHVLGVWVGRPDGSAVPGISGYATAAPLLFDAFVKSGVAIVPLPRAPAGALRHARGDLPVTLRRFGRSASEDSGVSEPAPEIVFPPHGARIELSRLEMGQAAQSPSPSAAGHANDTAPAFSPLVLKLQGGRAPFRWLANGKPLAAVERRRTSRWVPDGGGFSTLTVIDAAGRVASVNVFVE